MASPDPHPDLLTGTAAIDAIEAIRHACSEYDGADPLDEAAQLRLKHHGLTGVEAWVSSGGFALRHGEVLDLAVAPDQRGQGLGRTLAGLACADPGELLAWSHGHHPAAAALARSWGFQRIRELWVMRRRTGVQLAAAEPPAGVFIRDFGTSDAEALLRVNAAAFAHHPEQGDLDAEGLSERMSEPWFDPAGVLLAVDASGELLGFHWTKQHDAHTGEVYVVGIAPSAQGRGLGRVLTVAGLHHLASRGVEEVVLYVESDNTAARRLYEGIGFSHASKDTHSQYRRVDVPELAP